MVIRLIVVISVIISSIFSSDKFVVCLLCRCGWGNWCGRKYVMCGYGW